MEKKLYWQLESNYDLIIVCQDRITASEILESDFECLDEKEQKDVQYTLTPVWYTDQEYHSLPEAE